MNIDPELIILGSIIIFVRTFIQNKEFKDDQLYIIISSKINTKEIVIKYQNFNGAMIKELLLKLSTVT